MKIVLLNGAPRAGKDTAGKLILEYVVNGQNGYHYKFSDPLKSSVHAMFHISIEPDALESVKDVPHAGMFGKTPREMYIHFSEHCMKPKLGQNVFAELMVKRLELLRSRHKDSVVVATDCGFQPEADVLIDFVGTKNVLLVELRREGCSFKGDSRGYLKARPGMQKLLILNNGTIRDLRLRLVNELSAWVNGY